jgi:hypothetical protein
MKAALLIHAYPGCEAGLIRHWPYFKRSGCDLFGVGREGHVMQWPESMVTKDIGPNGYIESGQLPERLTDTFQWFLEDPRFGQYTHAAIVEWDSIFLKPMPQLDGPAYAQLAGGNIAGLKARQYYHNPWILDRPTAQNFCDMADKQLAVGDRECGNPDFFFGLVFEKMNFAVEPLEGAFSRNSLDRLEDLELARDRVRQGYWLVHGVKTPAMLEGILS